MAVIAERGASGRGDRTPGRARIPAAPRTRGDEIVVRHPAPGAAGRARIVRRRRRELFSAVCGTQENGELCGHDGEIAVRGGISGPGSYGA